MADLGYRRAYRRDMRETRRVALLFRLAQARERLALRVKGRPSPSSTIVLAGSGRGGTTWLARLIAAAAGMQIIFEPLHPNHVPLSRGLKGPSGVRDVLEPVYLRPNQTHERWLQFFHRVLAGEVRNWWTDQDRAHLFPWRYVVKLIRSNLMLAWLGEHLSCPIVLLVRHPCAVIRSRLSRGWIAPVKRLLNQPALMEDYVSDFKEVMCAARDDLERHAVLWAVETKVALEQIRGGKGALVFFETLCARPIEQMRDLYARLGLAFNSRTEKMIRKQSSVADEWGVSVSREQLIGRWQRDLSTTDRDRILGIVRAFGLYLYDETPYPQTVDCRR